MQCLFYVDIAENRSERGKTKERKKEKEQAAARPQSTLPALTSTTRSTPGGAASLCHHNLAQEANMPLWIEAKAIKREGKRET